MPSSRAARVLVYALFLSGLTPLASIAAPQQFGTLVIQARPDGADVLIDGEPWTGSGGNRPLQVQLAPGPHRIEVRAPGRRPYVSDVMIRANETTPLNVSLPMASQSQPELVPRTPPAAAGPPQPGTVVQVSSGEDGPVFAPDVKFTEVNHDFATLIGAYGGYVFAGQIMFGGGGYWQANSTNGLHIAYGGPVVEWRAVRGRTIGFTLHALVGGGTTYTDYHYGRYDGGPYVDPRGQNGRNVRVSAAPYPYPYYYDYETFFVADPEAQLVIHFGSNVRLQGSVGYRATSTGSLNGVTGGVSVQIGR